MKNQFLQLGVIMVALSVMWVIVPVAAQAAELEYTITMSRGQVVGSLLGDREVIGEYHRWGPNVIVLHKGDTVKLTVVNDAKTLHSLTIPDLKVKTGSIKPGEKTELTFTTDSAGVYQFACGIRYDAANKGCDLDHKSQTGYVIVLE